MRLKVLVALWLTFSVFLVSIVVVGVIWFHYRSFEAKITIEVAPADSTVMLDGKQVAAGSWRINDGEHHISFERTGFSSVSRKIVAEKGDYYIGEVLQPKDSQYIDWYSTHSEDQKLAENISSHNFDSNNQQTLNSNPWIKDLPYINLEPYFQISYGNSQQHPTDPSKLAIYVSANTEQAKTAVLKWFSDHGIDTENLEVIYL